MDAAVLLLAGVWRFASPAEALFTLAMLAPLVFFGCCVLALWRLLLRAIPARGQVALLAPSDETPAASPPTGPATARPRFALLIPAHNEELLLGAALRSLWQMDYPRSAYRVVVIADNCTDRTAQIGREEGALVLERTDTERIGKGYALEWALQSLLCATPEPNDALAQIADFDAVVILDADTRVSANLLSAFALALQKGQKAMQARYDVLNVGESWRTRLMTCALALAHVVKPLGREQLGLSDGLKGNGMCFARQVVETVPWSGASITEDIEYTLRLCRAGVRVAFLPDAAVWAQMPTSGKQAATQRKRWEGGRYRLLFHEGPRLLVEGLRARNRMLTDRALELIIPPFAEMFAVPVALLGVCALTAGLTEWHWAMALTWGWGLVLALQAGYLAGGLWVAKVPAKVAVAVCCAPFYILWKFGLYAVMSVTGGAGGWKRTGRH